LRYVKALGLYVDGRAQVSMNLTNFRETPLARVVEFVRREAQRYGVAIHHSELVGLIPEDALIEAALWYTQLDQFEFDQILERRLRQAFATQPDATPVPQPRFLDELASDAPTPGGGSAAAYSGAMAAALVAMVARLTLGRKKFAPVEAQMQQALQRAEALRAELTEAVKRDADAFQAVLAAFKLPKDTPQQAQARQHAVQDAIRLAAQVPLEVAHACLDVMELAAQVVELGNPNALSDGAGAAFLAGAALRVAAANVRINLASLEDHARVKEMLESVRKLEERAAALEDQVRQSFAVRGGINL